MKVRVAVNGFGRIGRLFLRSILDYPQIECVAINDLASIDTLVHLFKYDSTHGKFDGTVRIENGNQLIINEKHSIAVLAEPNPEKLPWESMGVEIVIESSGKFRKRQDVSKHIQAGAKKVIVSAPATDPDWTVVMGVNHQDYDTQTHTIISNASCTTNCLAPVVKVLMDNFGVERGIMTTVHAYTNDQNLLDLPHKDLRRARAAALSMVPTSTGAAKAVALVIPELKGKLSGLAIRVPTANVSLVDLVVTLKNETTAEQINQAMKTAADGTLKDILAYTDEEVVSVDFNHDAHSAIFDSKLTISDGKLAKVFAWYDNEWGYSCRIRDLILFMMGK